MSKGDAFKDLESLIAASGSGVVILSRATMLCRDLGLSHRLLVGLEERPRERWVEIAGGTADLTIGIRDADHSVSWLGEPERVGEDTLAWTLVDGDAQPVSWLEITNDTRSVRVRLADSALALISVHGGRGTIGDLVAEPVLWVADFLEGIAHVATGTPATSNADNRWPHDRQLRSRRALELIRQH